MKGLLFLLLFLMAALSACNKHRSDFSNTEALNVSTDEEHKSAGGELSFLLDYNDKIPEDVGFLSNHVVERRLANLMKDSFQVLSTKTLFSSPLVTSKQTGLITAKYYCNRERTELSAVFFIDTRQEIFWVYYFNGGDMVKFTDNSSVMAPVLYTREAH